MKEIDKITIRIERLFNDLHMPELYACADKCFSYGADNDDVPTVFYSIIEENEELKDICDRLFSDFYVQQTHENLPVSQYTFSILHEVGHHKTMKMFSKGDIQKYRYDCISLMEKRLTGRITIEEEQKRYMYLPVEYEATKEACRLVQENLQLLKDFEEDMKILAINFQKALDNGADCIV